jgi:hypothetical protein
VAGPDDYLQVIPTLQPGDTLSLRAGVYDGGLTIRDLHGAPDRPIVIRGPHATNGERAVFAATNGRNTVSLAAASYIIIGNLWLDGQHAEADAVKAEGGSLPVHDITLERLTIVGHDRGQDIVGISTKCPAWRWVIRDNVIVGAGTGMYLGNSDGSAPFVAGTIERNVVVDSIGYGIEIKYQAVRTALAGMPDGPSVTTLSDNVFAKSRNSSTGANSRPNVLLGSVPAHGAGTGDRYQMSHNILVDNRSEALFQGEGNLRLEHNVFVNPHGDAINVQRHHDRPREVTIANNLVIARGAGISVTGADPKAILSAARNAVYAEKPITGVIDGSNRVRAYPAPHGTLRRWLAQAWSVRDRSVLSSVLTTACLGAAAGIDVCGLVGDFATADADGATSTFRR